MNQKEGATLTLRSGSDDSLIISSMICSKSSSEMADAEWEETEGGRCTP